MLHFVELSFEQISEKYILHKCNTKGYFMSFKKEK